MSNLSKVLLTIPTLLGWLFFISTWFPKLSIWLYPTMDDYSLYVSVAAVLGLIQVGFLLKTLYSFKTLTEDEKRNWTWFFLVFNVIAAPVFIWHKVNVFKKREAKNKMENGL